MRLGLRPGDLLITEPCSSSSFFSLPCSPSPCRLLPQMRGCSGLLPTCPERQSPPHPPYSPLAITFLRSICVPQGIKKNTCRDLTESNQLFSSHVNVAALLILNGFNAEFIC